MLFSIQEMRFHRRPRVVHTAGLVAYHAMWIVLRRLERNWYSVELSMNEWWDQCVSFAQEKPAQPVLKVSVMADGRIAVNRAPATIQSLRESLQKLSQQKGVVCYYREAANSEGSPKVKQAVQAIVDARLPVRFSSRPDYSDVDRARWKANQAIAILRRNIHYTHNRWMPGMRWIPARRSSIASPPGRRRYSRCAADSQSDSLMPEVRGTW